jgi:hypothetical protein
MRPRLGIEVAASGDLAWQELWRVAGVSATEHSVISRGPSRCRVEMSVPWWAVSYLGVVRLALTRIRRRAEGAAGNGGGIT